METGLERVERNDEILEKMRKKAQATEIEIWDNTEENKCVHSFFLEDDEVQKISIRKQKNPRDSVFIDIGLDEVVVITAHGTKEFPI